MNTTRILQAVAFATKAHQGVSRKYTDEPYILHPIRVAQTVSENDGTQDMIIAALLHDVVEDCPNTNPNRIRELFGHTVYGMVFDLTDLPKDAGNREFRKLEANKRLKNASGDVQTIKCADFIDNLPSIVEHEPEKFGPRFVREKAELIPYLTKANPFLYRKAYTMLKDAAIKLNIYPLDIPSVL